MPMSPGPTRPDTRELADAPAPTPEARLFALSLDLLGLAGFDGYLKLVNPAWESVLGWTAEEIYARPYLEIVHPDDRERTAAEALALAGDRTETRDFEIRVLLQGRRAPLDRLQRALHRRGAALHRRPRRHRPPGARGAGAPAPGRHPAGHRGRNGRGRAPALAAPRLPAHGLELRQDVASERGRHAPGAGRLVRADATRAARLRRGLRRVLVRAGRGPAGPRVGERRGDLDRRRRPGREPHARAPRPRRQAHAGLRGARARGTPRSSR